jgi:hypothetical protein
MALNLLKLCVGCDSVEDLEEWIAFRLDERRRAGEPVEHWHTTRMVPTRGQEVTDGGSLYWVIKGFIQLRQRVIDLREEADSEGRALCAIVFDPLLVPTRPTARRPFQGWRYLPPEDVPPDLPQAERGALEAMPAKMRAELAALALL